MLHSRTTSFSHWKAFLSHKSPPTFKSFVCDPLSLIRVVYKSTRRRLLHSFHLLLVCWGWVWSLHMSVQVVYPCIYACRGQRKTLSYSSIVLHCIPLSLNQKFAVQARLSGQWASRIHPSLPPNVGSIGMHSHAQHFTEVLGIQTQVLMLEQQVFLPTEPPL